MNALSTVIASPTELRDPSAASLAALGADQAAFLLQLLSGNDPRHLHFELPLWTPAAIAEVIYDEFGRSVDPPQLQLLLRDLGALPGDPLLALDPPLRRTYSHWCQTELGARLAEAQLTNVWWLTETAVSYQDAGCGAGEAGRYRSATVLVAMGSDGRCAFWFCRGVAGVETRTDFLARLLEQFGRSALLACGLEDCYAEAAQRLPTLRSPQLLLLDARSELATHGANAGLFRQEVYAARQRRLEGEVLIVQPLPLRLLSAGSALLLLAVALFVGFGHYARTQNAPGVVLPSGGVLRVRAAQNGLLDEIAVAVGDRVQPGQVLARLRSQDSDASGRGVDARIVEQLRQSLAAGAAEQSTLQRQRELETQQLQEALSNAERQYQTSAQQHALQGQRQDLLDDRLARSEKLAADGVIARVALQDMQEQALSGRVQTLALAREKDSAAAAVAAARTRRQQYPLDFAQRERALALRVAELEQRLAQAELGAGSVLLAPRAGQVAAVLAPAGSSIEAGRALFLLVDEQAPLLVELFVPSRAIGFVRTGQAVQLKLDAFPYQRYGYQRGSVAEISRTTLSPQELDIAVPGNEPLYRVRVALASQSVAAHGERRPLAAGMRLDADIVIDRPRILDALLEPLFSLRGR